MTFLPHTESGLDKTVWTDSDFDFDSMGWHDAHVHAINIQEYHDGTLPPTRVVLDFDYLVRWVPPQPPAKQFTFWVAPATLVFEQAWNIIGGLSDCLEVADLHRLPSPDRNPDPSKHLDGHTFDLRLRSPGFTQYLRRQPVLVAVQRLTSQQRGGISVAEIPYVPGDLP